jgi:tetrahydromethanopterin S-methyltransferase subunit G
MIETEVPEYSRKLLEQVSRDAAMILAGIFIVLILVYLLDLWARWHEIGRKYGVK